MKWWLELVCENERPRYVADRLLYLQQHYPALHEIAHSTCFVIFGCERGAPLTNEEKDMLLSYIEQKVIKLFRCKQLQDRRNE